MELPMNDQIERVADFIVNAKRIVIFVGAGLSTESVSLILEAPKVFGISMIRRISISRIFYPMRSLGKSTGRWQQRCMNL